MQTTNGTTLLERARGIDQIASAAMALYEGASSMEAELGVAQAISDLRGALTPEIMRPIMALMNTDLGFLTDRDPRKAKAGQQVTPYTVDDVKDVLIEAKLRGFHAIGNEFNIISRRFYAAKAGLKRRCETWPGVTKLKILIGLPRNATGGAVVPVEATWEKSGIADSIKTEVAVKVNEFMGADAIVGKAERKLYKRVFDRLSGRVTPDGEVGEDDEPKQLPPAPPPPTAELPPPPAPKPTPAPESKPEPIGERIPTILPPVATPEPERDPFALTELQQQVHEIVVAAGSNFDGLKALSLAQFTSIPIIAGVKWDEAEGYTDLSDAACRWFISNQVGLAGRLKKGVK